MRFSKAHQVKAVRFVIGNGETGVALGAMTSTLGDLVIELSPHREELAIFLYGFDRQMMG